MSDTLTALGISGSLRKGSINTALLRLARELAPDGMVVEIADISGVPLYNADVEARGMPAAVETLRASIREADALLLACPEYNCSIAPALKNAIDWASRPGPDRPLDEKPVAILSAGGRRGAMRAQHHLRHVCVGTNMFPLNKPEVALPIAQNFDEDGNPANDDVREQVATLVANLLEWTKRLKGA